MEHFFPANEIRLRVLLNQFRDYIHRKVSWQETNNQSWTIFLMENVANDLEQLQLLGVSRDAVLFLKSEFWSLSHAAHGAPANLISQAIDAVLCECHGVA